MKNYFVCYVLLTGFSFSHMPTHSAWLLQRFDQMVQDLASRCPTFRFSKDEVRNVLRDVADYKAPGVYVLSDYTKKHELAALEIKYGSSAAASKSLPTGPDTLE